MNDNVKVSMMANWRRNDVFPAACLCGLILIAGCAGQASQAKADEGKQKPSNKRSSASLNVAEVAPDFTLSSFDGKREVTLSSFQGKRPVVLFFGSYT